MISRASLNRRCAAGGISLLLVLSPGQVVGTPSMVRGGPELKLDRSLRTMSARIGLGGAELVDVIVAFHDQATNADRTLASRVGAVTNSGYVRLPFQAMRLPARYLLPLAADRSVKFVVPDSEVLGASKPARQTARVPGSTAALYTPNMAFKGNGVPVAIVDTGVWAHDDFYADVQQFDFVGGLPGIPTAPSDPFGHGTHVAGMVGADGRNSSSAKYQGAATRAQVLALRVLDGEGRGQMSDVLRALDWILEVGIPTYGIRVANLSLGKGVEDTQDHDPLVQAVDAVWDAGVVVVVSAGNHGQSGHYTITSPGISRKVITVGSLTDRGTGTNYADDFVSSFSSRGPTLFDHVLKPDLLAPGNKIVAPYSESSRLGSLVPPSRILCGYQGTCEWHYLQLSGTSMAAGVVSGAVARMLDKDPSLSPSTIKARLMKSARKIQGDPTLTGAGVLDVDAAMNATGTIAGQALSPLMNVSEDGSVVYVQDPALLWGDGQWAAGYLWPDGSLWAESAGGFLWSEGSLWPDSSLWADAYLWSEGFLWPDSVIPASADVEDPGEEPAEDEDDPPLE